ncbi:DUF4157 domain-containing protein [Embleya scabrispora]|nr:DUF4157 domain-containing protein [Embleya scabrispora]
MKAGGTAAHLPAELEARAERARPLDAALRGPMERSFGTSLGDVVVHTDADAAASADRLDAKAYAVGRHVVFGPGRYDPHSTVGRALIGHELAHVVQQRRGGPQPGPRGVHPSGTAAEGAAHTAGARAAAGLSAPVAAGTAPGVSRAPKNDPEDEARLAEVKQRNRSDAMVALGTAEGTGLEVTGLVDTVIGLDYAAHDVGRLGVDKAASALGLSADDKKTLHTVFDVVTGGAVLDAIRERAKASGWVDPLTGAPALSPKVTAAGNWAEAEYDRLTGSHAIDDGSLFTERELAQIATSLGLQTALAFTGVEEVALVLKVLGVATSVKGILDAINADPEHWPSDSRFWIQVVGAVLNVAGLAASSAGKRLAGLLVDAALTTLATAPSVLKLWGDWKNAQGPDRDEVLRKDLKEVLRALAAVLHQILLRASSHRRSKTPGGPGGSGTEEHGGPPAKRPQPAAAPHPTDAAPPVPARAAAPASAPPRGPPPRPRRPSRPRSRAGQQAVGRHPAGSRRANRRPGPPTPRPAHPWRARTRWVPRLPSPPRR